MISATTALREAKAADSLRAAIVLVLGLVIIGGLQLHLPGIRRLARPRRGQLRHHDDHRPQPQQRHLQRHRDPEGPDQRHQLYRRQGPERLQPERRAQRPAPPLSHTHSLGSLLFPLNGPCFAEHATLKREAPSSPLSPARLQEVVEHSFSKARCGERSWRKPAERRGTEHGLWRAREFPRRIQRTERDAQDHVQRLRQGDGGAVQAHRRQAGLLQGLLREAQAAPQERLLSHFPKILFFSS